MFGRRILNHHVNDKRPDELVLTEVTDGGPVNRNDYDGFNGKTMNKLDEEDYCIEEDEADLDRYEFEGGDRC